MKPKIIKLSEKKKKEENLWDLQLDKISYTL